MSSKISLSENAQMYLLSMMRMGQTGRPVPLSDLAAALDVSPVSVNQMCRKLQDEGWVIYTPYRGASVTEAGRELAARLLRRHRLWEVFLVEHLQIRSEAAHDAACRLEHATSDLLADRLSAFLGHPRVNPEGQPIPDGTGDLSKMRSRSLAELRVGQAGSCVRCTADAASCAYLAEQGLRPGAQVEVVASTAEGLLLDLAGGRVALSMALATEVWVGTEGNERLPVSRAT